MNQISQFIASLLIRLFSGKPKFFLYIQIASIVTGLISSIIMYLQSIGTQLPSYINIIGNVNVIIVSIITTIISQLPNKGE